MSRILRTPRSRRRLAVLGVVLAGTLTAVTVNAAAPSFRDVPASHPFHAEIGAVASGGIALGYPDGNYRPGAPITRQAMAAFLARSLGRVAYASGTKSGTGTADRSVASVTMHHSASGYLVLNASTFATVNTEYNCPCLIGTRIVSGAKQSAHVFDELSDEDQPGGSVVASTANNWVLPVYGEGSTTVSLLARRVNATTGDPSATFEGSLTAQFVPFDHNGVFSG